MTEHTPADVANLQLLTDGTVMLGDENANWWRLYPDAFGNYVDGHWVKVASSRVARVFMPSAILKDGRYLVGGGEYVSGIDHATVEIYDPVADAWTAGPDMPAPIGDTAASILPDGRFYSSSYRVSTTYIYDPSTNVWSAAAPIGTGGTGDEKGWTLLQNGKVLDAYDVGSLYDPTQGTWTATGPLPAPLVANGEVGPMSLLYSGKVLQFGAALAPQAGHTAIYDPATNTWSAGADAPDGLQFGDSSATVLRNGNVLCSTTQFLSGGSITAMWEYDPTVVPPSPGSFTKVADGTSAFPNSPNPMGEPIMLQLPNGQVLVARSPIGSNSESYLYTPAIASQTAWAPAIGALQPAVMGAFPLLGTQLNGLTNGASFGDDFNLASAYPLVSFTDSAGHITYARTFGFDQMAPLPGHSGSCRFSIPDSLPDDTYLVNVVTNGIPGAHPLLITLPGGRRPISLTGGSRQQPGFAVVVKVTLDAPAPAGGTAVYVIGDPTVVSIPSPITISAGQTFANITVNSLAFGKTTIKASAVANGRYVVTRDFGWSVASIAGPPQASSGHTATWTVTLDSPAIAGTDGVVVNLQSSAPSVATVPATVTVPAGASSATFTVTAGSPNGAATITASMIGSSRSAPFSYFVTGLEGQWVAPANTTAPWAVGLNGPAPVGGLTVSLASSNTSIATVPATVTVPAGASFANFNVTAGPPGGQATITATVGSSSMSAVFGYYIYGITGSETPTNGNSATWTVSLNDLAPPGGATVTLVSNNPAGVTVPATVTIPAGAFGAPFVVTALDPTAWATISASLGTSTVTKPFAAFNITTNIAQPNQFPVGATATGTVTISSAAPAGGLLIDLQSLTPSVASTPGSITIAPGSTTGTYQVSGLAPGSARIVARIGTHPTSRSYVVNVTAS